MEVKLVLILYLALVSVISVLGYTPNAITSLRNKLFAAYDKTSRPVKDHAANTTVYFGLSVNDINLDDNAQRLTVVTYFYAMWTDEFLKWDPESNEGLTTLHFDSSEVWMPDIALFNSADDQGTKPTSTLPVLGYSDGKMMWVPPYVAHVPCQIDIRRWPKDVQACSLRFGSWAHHSEQLDLQIFPEVALSTEHYEENKKWRLKNYTSSRESVHFDADQYYYIAFNFTLERQASTHASYITHTSLAIVLMVVSSYLLPLDNSVTRILIHLISMVVLSISNVVLYMSIPMLGGPIPYVVRYYSATIILTAVSLMCNIFIAIGNSSNLASHKNLKESMMAALKCQLSPMPNDIENTEMVYSTLHDDVTSPIETEQQNKLRNSLKTSRKILRLVNAVFFVMFFFAYLVDFSMLKSSISEK